MKEKTFFRILVAIAMAQVLFCEAVTGEEPNPPPNKALVIIDTDAPSVKYDRRIFGGFLEHFDDQIYGGIFDPGSPLADEKGFRRDVLAALKELGTPIVRWPGGCFVSGYHWEFGVGKQRKPVDDMAWGVIESNAFGTDEYMELCRLLDWEPFICTNAGNGTIQEMLNWLEYCNGTTGDYARLRKANGFTEPHNVMIWSIGNENYHPTEIGHKPIEQWAPFVRQAAEAMKAADPDIKLTAAAQATRQWTLPLLEMGGPYLDYISIHSYWLHLWHRNDAPDYLTCIMHSEGPEQTLANCISILDESGYRGKIKIAYDEWNLRGWYHPKFPRTTVQDYSDPEVQRLVKARKLNNIPSQYTMADALFSASFFNACLRHADDVAMANIAPIVNTRGPLFVHPEGIVKRTHFHTMAMYAGQLQPRVGRLSLTADKLTHGDKSVPVADAIATVDESGKQWAIALVNRHPNKPLSCTVKFGERTLEGMFDALVLAGDSPDAYNDIQHPNRVVPRPKQLMFRQNVVSLPPHSLTIIKIDTFAQARQPILPDFHADPSARVFDGKLYIYPSHDAPGARNWKDMVDWHVFSTDDMVTWTDHGVIFSLEDISWADTEAWAPDCIERNGKYYFYLTFPKYTVKKHNFS